MNTQKKRAIIAAVIAGLFATESYAATTTSPAPVTSPTVKCRVTNSCGAKNSCNTANSKNIVNNLTAKECEDKGGKVVQ